MVKEHNAIATKLASAYPTMTDQQLFDKARMINAAVIAKIHTIEWTPAILPNNNLAVAMYTNWQVRDLIRGHPFASAWLEPVGV